MTRLNGEWLFDHEWIMIITLGIIIGGSSMLIGIELTTEHREPNDIAEHAYEYLTRFCEDQGYYWPVDFYYNQYEEDYSIQCFNWWFNETSVYLLERDLGQ